jgi:hypothetical protein
MFFNRARRLTLDGVFGDPSYAAPLPPLYLGNAV